MKKLIALLALLSTALFCQWGTAVATSINLTSSFDRMDMVTNRNGNNILYKEASTGNIKFYLLDAQGGVVRSSTLNSSGDFPNIVGTNDKIFALYKSGNYIEIKKSTDAGANWTALNSLSLSANTCNGIDAVMDSRGVHVAFAQRDNGNYYETYYYLFNNENEWTNYQNVTDETSMNGGFPSIAVSDNRVHVSFLAGVTSSDPYVGVQPNYIREKYNDTWQSSELFSSSLVNKLYVSGNNIFNFYNIYGAEEDEEVSATLYSRKKTIGQSTWSDATFFGYNFDMEVLPSPSTTTDGTVHLLVNYMSYVKYYSYNGSSWSSPTTLYNSIRRGPSRLTSVSNDVYAVYAKSVNNVSSMYFNRIDATPLAPTGMQMATATGNHPQISWTRNNEPDINTYRIYRNYGGSSWQLLTSVGSSTSSYTDATITLAEPNGEAGATIYYKVAAVDLNSNVSGYSSTVSCVSNDLGIEKRGETEPGKDSYSFYLGQNYPNPFNPSTSISYTVPVKGFVTLKVYDLFGSEVAALVNRDMEAGNYSAVFNASGLASGIYVYKLQVNEMQLSKKLTLLK